MVGSETAVGVVSGAGGSTAARAEGTSGCAESADSAAAMVGSGVPGSSSCSSLSLSWKRNYQSIATGLDHLYLS